MVDPGHHFKEHIADDGGCYLAGTVKLFAQATGGDRILALGTVILSDKAENLRQVGGVDQVLFEK